MHPEASHLTSTLRTKKCFCPWLGLFFLALAAQLEAHPVSVTSTMVSIEDQRVLVEIEVLAEDLAMFYEMETDDTLYYTPDNLQEQAKKHCGFLLQHIHILDQEGRGLTGSVVDLDLSALPQEGIYFNQLMDYWMTYQIEFPFTEPPETLTVMQDLGGKEPPIPSEMSMQIFHKGVRLETLMLEHGQFQSFRLDWDRAWGEIADDPEAVRQAYFERRDELLGITASMNLYSFVYLERDGLRHEMLIPLNTLDEWIPLERANKGYLNVQEQHELKEKLDAFLAKQQEVSLNGRAVEPRLTRITFYGPSPSDYGASPPEKSVPVIGGRLGVAYFFPAQERPYELTFAWKEYKSLSALEPRFFVFEEGNGETHILYPGNESFTWKGERLPGSDLMLASLPTPPQSETWQVPILALGSTLLGLVLLAAGLVKRRCSVLIASMVFLGVVPLVWSFVNLEINHGVSPKAMPTEEEVTPIFATLQQNIYRAFEQRKEGAIYDALAESVAGPLLEDFYLEVIRGLRMEELGGGISRVESVELLEKEITELSGQPRAIFEITATWNVSGTLEHWGHIHSRTNQYRARFHIEGLADGWRITHFEPLNQKLVSLKVRVRG